MNFQIRHKKIFSRFSTFCMIFYAGIFSFTNLSAQIPGEFMCISSDARSYYLAGASVSLEPDSHSSSRNPAQITSEENNIGFSYSCSRWSKKVNDENRMHDFSFFYNDKGYFAVAMGIKYNKNKDYPGMEKIGKRPKDIALDLTGVYDFTGNFSVALTGRYLRISPENNRHKNAFTADLSMYYRTITGLKKIPYFTFGFQAYNFGTKLKSNGVQYDLPGMLKIGSTCHLKDMVLGILDLNLTTEAIYYVIPENSNSYAFCLAGETRLLDAISFGGGYHFSSEPNKMEEYGSIGWGLHFFGCDFDFAYLLAPKNNRFHDTMMFSLGWSF